MKILFLTFGNEVIASSRTRVYQYLPALREAGDKVLVINYCSAIEARVAALRSSNTSQQWSSLIRRRVLRLWCLCFTVFQTVRFVVLSGFYDIVFIQKVLLPAWIQRIVTLLNTNVVFDYDDAVYAESAPYSRQRFEGLLKSSSLAIVENDATEQYAKDLGVRTVKITGPIDTERYRPRPARREERPVVIGWIGSPGTTPYLRLIAEPLRTVIAKYPDVIVDFVGAGPIDLPGVTIRRHEWSLDTEVSSLEMFDVGVMPLPDNEWTRGKGGYKLLQYMAMGIPGVASPVGINSQVVRHGANGFLATTDDEWIEALTRLIESKELRQTLGERARRDAIETYSLRSSTPVLHAALKSLIHGPKHP